jgi:acyl carrier protein
MKKEEFLREIEEIVGAKHGTVSMESNLQDLPQWDSMAYITFIALADSKLNLSVDANRLASCKTVRDLAALADISLD